MTALDHVIDELTYQNYAANRDYAPHISPQRWGRIYANVEPMEARYQAEKAISKAQADLQCPECGHSDVDLCRDEAAGMDMDTYYKACIRCGHKWGQE